MNANYIQTFTPTLRQRVARKLFPYRPLVLDDVKGAKDGVHTTVEIYISWMDRVRLLASGRAQVRVSTQTEHVVGKCHSQSVFVPRPPDWMA